MSAAEDTSPTRVRRTFAAEAIRAICTGVLETALATFAILIAVKEFESSATFKSVILASPAIGLLGGLLGVSLLARSRVRVSAAAGAIGLISTFGFLIAAIGAESEHCFLIGMTVGNGLLTMGMPMQTHYLRHNYPTRRRGRLFSLSVLIRALTCMLTSWVFGSYLDQDFDRYSTLLWLFVLVAALASVCQFSVPSRPLRSDGEVPHRFFDSLHLAKQDPVFLKLLLASMVLGVGILSAMALRVDYLANPIYGLDMDVKTVSLITGIVPSVVRLVSTFFWGWLFDRINFFHVRVAVNLVFLAGLYLYFRFPDPVLILIGSALFGLGRGGGEIFFNLFVTKLAKPDHVADYMSVHTFLAGVRSLFAPFLGFLVVQQAGIGTLVVMCMSLVIISLIVVGLAWRQSRLLESKAAAATRQ